MTYQLNDVDLIIDRYHILKNINIQFKKGEVHAIVGGNGAGKSSLMKVLLGLYNISNGQIVNHDNDSIAFVAQEVDEALFPDLSVYDNLTISDLKQGILYRRQQLQKINSLLQNWNVKFHVNTLVKDLSIAEKQQLLIMRAMLTDSDFIILDEPTASLSRKEVNQLFNLLNHLKQQNKGIIFISHRIHELMEISDWITVLKTGEIVESKAIEYWSEERILNHLAEHMHIRTYREVKEVVYTEKSLSLQLKKGQVVGIAGLLGAGKTRLANRIFYETKGAYIPEERQKHGLVMDASISDNVNFHKPGWMLSKKKEIEYVNATKKRLNVKFQNAEQTVKTLSGGNQQKIVLMKWLDSNKDIFIFDEPTVGIDIGAKQDIFREVNALADQGKSIVYLTSDFNELLNVADYIYVLFQGEVVSDGDAEQYTEAQLLSLASGGHYHEV